MDFHAAAEVLAQDRLGQPGDQSAGVPAWIQVQEKVTLRLHGEGAVGKTADGSSEKSLDTPPHLPTGRGKQGFFTRKAPEATGWPQVPNQKFAGVKESLFRVRTTKDEMEEVLSPLIGDSLPFSHLFLEKPDLLIHDLTQAQAPGHRLSRVLGSQDLCRKIEGPYHLQKGQAHHRRNPGLPTGTDPGAHYFCGSARIRFVCAGHDVSSLSSEVERPISENRGVKATRVAEKCNFVPK